LKFKSGKESLLERAHFLIFLAGTGIEPWTLGCCGKCSTTVLPLLAIQKSSFGYLIFLYQKIFEKKRNDKNFKKLLYKTHVEQNRGLHYKTFYSRNLRIFEIS
jgi:hypothetical protein